MTFKENKTPFDHDEYILSIYSLYCSDPLKHTFYVPDGNLELMMATELLTIFSGTNLILTKKKNIFWGQERFTGTIESRVPYYVFGIKFQPWLFPLFMKKKNINLVDKVLPMENVLSRAFIKKVTHFFESWNFDNPNIESIDDLSYAMKNELDSELIVKPNFKNTLTELRRRNGICSIAELQKIHKQSLRTLEYDFEKNIGLKPKEYQNIIRFRKSCLNLKETHSIIQTTLNYGYYDQSHYTNYFIRTCQKNPTTFLDQENLLLSTV